MYLSVAVYMPFLRASRSEIKEPVMCTTLRVDESGNSSSCSEWCLSKGSGTSKNRQIFVHLRQNGSRLIFNNCDAKPSFHVNSCDPIDFNKLPKHKCRTEKKTEYDKATDKHTLIEKNECDNLTGLFHCFSHDGVCYDVGKVLDCNSHNENFTKLTCGLSKKPRAEFVKLDCSEVHGVFECKNGNCSRVDFSKCGHDCGAIKIQGKNVVIMSDDNVVTMKCSSATRIEPNNAKVEVWNADENDRDFFMVSCMNFQEINPEGVLNTRKLTLEATDCVDGVSFTETDKFDVNSSNITYMNLSQIYTNMTKNNSIVPEVKDLTIHHEAKLLINLEVTAPAFCKYTDYNKLILK